MIGNTRLFQAVQALATGEGDARKRVSIACQIIEKMHPDELSPDQRSRIQRVLADAGKAGPYRVNQLDIDRYTNTSSRRTNRTYSRFSKEILSIWLETAESDT